MLSLSTGLILLGVFVSNIISEDMSLLIRKCCPEGQQLNTYLTECIHVSGRHSDASKKRVTASELRTEENPDYPWWMNREIKPLSPDTLSEMSSFLGGQHENKYIEIGIRQPCELRMAAVINSAKGNINLLHNGSLLYSALNGTNMTFSPSSYCTDAVQTNKGTGYAYLLCSCLETTCIRKCCNSRSLLSINENRYSYSKNCIANNASSWQPEFYNVGIDGNLTKVQGLNPYYLFYRNHDCRAGRTSIVTDSSDWWIFPNGSVQLSEFGHGVPFEPQDYCGDLLAEDDRAPHLIVCVPIEEPAPLDVHYVVYAALFIVAALCLVITLIVMSLLPRRYRDVLAKTVMCHCACLSVAYVILAASNLLSTLQHAYCIANSFIIQFSFLAAFFWLNVMCIDISWAFSGIRPPQGSVTERDHKKFLYYSIYAWGSPTVITIVTAIMEFDESIPNTFVKPNFGVAACWFEEKIAAFAYFYGPMAVLLVANFALFIYTTIKIIKVQRDTRILRNGESGRHDGSSNFKKDKKRLILYAKLFCLMGLTWVTEIISWLHGSAQYYWYITDAINLLRAVFIFIIFCCKRKVFRLLKQRLFPSLASKNNASQSNGTRKSSSSTQQSSLQSMQMAQINGNSKGNSTNTGNP